MREIDFDDLPAGQVEPGTHRFSLLEFFVLICALGLVIGLVLPALNCRRPSSRTACHNNLRLLALAMLYYHDDHGSFPPACVYDENGRPAHSWRVLLLPYLEEQALYDAYSFDEPWDGPNNRKLADKMPDFFRCTRSKRAGKDRTHYVVLRGEGSVFPTKGSTTLKQIRDGISDTILVVELPRGDTPWMAPRDFDASKFSTEFLEPGGSSRHSGVGLVAFADGHSHRVSMSMGAETLEALMTANGNDDINWEN